MVADDLAGIQPIRRVGISPQTSLKGGSNGIRVETEYRPAFGEIGSVAASLFGENPKQQMYDDRRALKQVLEVGEKARPDASILPTMHAAQPPSEVSTGVALSH
jgi:hypothetical protein